MDMIRITIGISANKCIKETYTVIIHSRFFILQKFVEDTYNLPRNWNVENYRF